MDDEQEPLSLTTPHDALDAPTQAPPPQESTPAVAFLAPLPSSAQLVESAVYRPGAAVAVALLVGPAVCAIAGGVAASMTGAIPVWLPFVLLLWLPTLALAWALLKSVRVTPDTLACGRPLGQWRVIPFHEIERMERRGLRLVVTGRSGSPLSFTPWLLHRGAHLRRTLLLRLPLAALPPALRSEAQMLNGDDLAESHEGGVEGVFTVRPRRLWLALGCSAAVAALAGAVAAYLTLSQPVNIALGVTLLALAGALCFLGVWTLQEVFVSEKGLIVHHALLRYERDIFWAQLRLIEYTPGEMALLLRSARTVVCIGPGLLDAQQARLMRRYISRYCLSPVVSLFAWRGR